MKKTEKIKLKNLILNMYNVSHDLFLNILGGLMPVMHIFSDPIYEFFDEYILKNDSIDKEDLEMISFILN